MAQVFPTYTCFSLFLLFHDYSPNVFHLEQTAPLPFFISCLPLTFDATSLDLSFLLEQDLPNAAYSDKSVYCYMHAENHSTYCSATFLSHGDAHCMSSIDEVLCVCHDIVDHEKRADDISNCLDSRMVQASFSHSCLDNSFRQIPVCNEICEGMIDLLSATLYGGPAPYMNNDVMAEEVGDEKMDMAYAGS